MSDHLNRAFVLKDTHASRRRKKPVYFGGMSGIGPKYTENLEEAELFKSKQDAFDSPAYLHSMCFFEPAEVQSERQDAHLLD